MVNPRILALGGIAGPVFFTTAILVAAALRPEYSHYAQFGSELGETGGVSAPVMNFLGFLPTGACIFVFSLALWSRLGGTWAGWLGSAFVSVFAIGIFVSGIYSCDLTCTPETPSAEQRMHNLAGAFTFPSFVLAPLVLGWRFRQLDRWRSLFPYSVTTAVLSACAMVALVESVPDRSGTGLFQRIVLGLTFLWLIAVSLRLRAIERHQDG